MLYLKKVIRSLQLPEQSNSAHIAIYGVTAAVFFEDNAAAVNYSENPASQYSMKYLETNIYWINDYHRSGDLKVASQDRRS